MKKKRLPIGERIFNVFNYGFFTILGITTLLPFVNLIAKSFSSEKALISGKVGLFPVEFQTETYKFVLANPQFLNAFKISILVTVIGTALGLIMTVLIAYPLSKPHLKGRKILLIYFVFAMIFNGGLIPTYLVIQKLGLVNNFWVMVLPVVVNVYNMLIMKNYFESLPDSIEESAKIDGASTMRILTQIIIPLSKPVLATIALFFAVAHWNSYYNAMIYITRTDLKPLQLYLKELVASAKDVLDQAGYADFASPESVQAASIVAATIPIIVVYPKLQKYFVKGVLVGSVKG